VVLKNRHKQHEVSDVQDVLVFVTLNNQRVTTSTIIIIIIIIILIIIKTLP